MLREGLIIQDGNIENVDPLWYLLYGPSIIIPRELCQNLTLQDLVEVYCLYPQMNWDKYPRLKKSIIDQVSTEKNRDSFVTTPYKFRIQLQEFNFVDSFWNVLSFIIRIWNFLKSLMKNTFININPLS